MPARVRALGGALGFLTQLPVGQHESHWAEFRERPVTFVVSGYVIGLLLVPAIALPLPPPTAAIVFLGWLYIVTGINHLDGLADVGDAFVVHGDADRRREVLSDTVTGVGALLAVVGTIVGIAFAAFGVASAGFDAIGIVIAAEVGAKLGMAAVVCFGTAAFEGLGAQLTERSTPAAFIWPAMAALPVVFVTWPHPAAAGAVIGALVVTVGLSAWATTRLGGVNGDVMGATNEIARVTALHMGVVLWTLY